MKISEKNKREYLVNAVKAQLKVSIDVCKYHKSVAPNTKIKRMFTKKIKECEYAIARLDAIKHLDIAEYLFNVIVGANDPNKVSYFLTCPVLVNSKKLKEWDTDEKHQEFVDFIEQQKKDNEEKDRIKAENTIAIQKAREMGKKVELVYNPKTKKVEPKIVEESAQA